MPYLAFCNYCQNHFDFYDFLYNLTQKDIKDRTIDNIELIVKCDKCKSKTPRKFSMSQFNEILVGLRGEYGF